MFQSTPPRGGRRTAPTAAKLPWEFQSTPPRGGRRDFLHIAQLLAPVSIHAPARGATPDSIRDPLPTKKFQSTPPRGGRLSDQTLSLSMVGFQSTPPRGGRLKGGCRGRPPESFQSTPPRGGRRRGFQSTPPRGGRHGNSFQSTPPRGGRLGPEPTDTLCSFNPRPRAGGD